MVVSLLSLLFHIVKPQRNFSVILTDVAVRDDRLPVGYKEMACIPPSSNFALLT